MNKIFIIIFFVFTFLSFSFSEELYPTNDKNGDRYINNKFELVIPLYMNLFMIPKVIWLI